MFSVASVFACRELGLVQKRQIQGNTIGRIGVQSHWGLRWVRQGLDGSVPVEPFVAEKLDPVTMGVTVKQLGRTLAHAFVSVATLEAAMELARGVWAITWRTATSI